MIRAILLEAITFLYSVKRYAIMLQYVAGKKCHQLKIRRFSSGLAAVSSGRSSPPLLAGGEEGDPPLCIGRQEVGTYIYSLLYTYTGLLDGLLMKFYRR
jgi:hypothetical protein